MSNRQSAKLVEISNKPLTSTPPASRFEEYCEGHFTVDSPQYLLGVSVKAAATDNSLTCPGSTLLDEINAFDSAEVAGVNLGQLNVITVSSFCGPQGMIWGYDVCPPQGGHRVIGSVTRGGQRADVLDLDDLAAPFERLIGTVEEKRFPFMPGSHVPAALKSKTSREPGILYAALALGIPTDRRREACLMMENTGFCTTDGDWQSQRQEILERQAQSVLAIGENQLVRYSKIFVGISSVEIKPGQTGCAMALAPYFRLAQNAFVNEQDLTRMTIEEWEAKSKDRFLAN